LVIAVTSLGLAFIGSPADAETKVRQDGVDDAPAKIDITRVRYSYGDDRVRAVARIPDLGRKGVAALSISRFEIFEAGYVVRIRKRLGEPPRVSLLYFDHFDLHPRECDGLSGAWLDSAVKLSVETSCLRGHARPRIFTQFGIQRGADFDRAPAVRRLARD
jgi:hypothetical protein